MPAWVPAHRVLPSQQVVVTDDVALLGAPRLQDCPSLAYLLLQREGQHPQLALAGLHANVQDARVTLGRERSVCVRSPNAFPRC